MQITDIRVRIVKNDEKLKGVASITIDDCFVVHDLKVISSNNQLFVAMPSRKTIDGEFKDVAHPIKTELREQLNKIILEAYNKALTEVEE